MYVASFQVASYQLWSIALLTWNRLSFLESGFIWSKNPWMWPVPMWTKQCKIELKCKLSSQTRSVVMKSIILHTHSLDIYSEWACS